MPMRHWLAQRLPQVWAQRGLVSSLLLPLGALYAAMLTLHRLAYARGLKTTHRLPVPVIVVGNVLAGGAGKTPTVLVLLRHLQARGMRVGVLSRGYGRHHQQPLLVQPDSTAREVGDEPLLIAQTAAVPVAVGNDRYQAGLLLLRHHPELQCLICDDGLQHRALARDLELCVFDARGLGNGRLLPAGPLREPWPRAVDLTLMTDEAAPVWPGTYRAQRTLGSEAFDAHGGQVPLATLAQSGQPLVAVAGIARPDAFFAMLRAAGVPLQTTVALPDHYDFDSWPGSLYKGQRLICTQKDAVKLWRGHPGALAVPLQLEPEAAFWRALDSRLDALLGHATPL